MHGVLRGAAIAVALLLAAASAARADGPFQFFTVTPCRVADTRLPADAPALQAGVQRIFQITGKCGVPSVAKAIAINVTVTNPRSVGHLRVFPADVSLPNVSTINFTENGPDLANGVIVSLPANGDGTIAVHPVMASSDGTVDLVLDVSGYFQ